ncbi:MAG: hypothetical protein Tp176DCM1853251_62 [Prokaryotic dsDNA virus sp.]|nr:MAG: hypothetical protein Tp176DCM1853251_62 [Prokaryotic dsDNA virus sp.]|tara:strand:- start:6129 stop:6488 length:360 start_codon:yes stop_codon:yes gene_type:complete
MSVFRELTFTYQGETLTVTPSLALLRRIKARGIHNVILANKCIHGGADLEDLAAVHHEFMRAAGREISEDESYGFVSGQNLTEIIGFQQAYVQAVLPAVDFGKKPEAPGKTKRASRAKG